jgi:hypothetical protein
VLQVRELGKKLRRLITSCDVCQRVKHPKCSFTTEQKKSNFINTTRRCCKVGMYWSVHVSKRIARYIFVCYVFSKFIKLFALKSVTTNACLNKLVNQYFRKVIKPKVILPDNANQFRSSIMAKVATSLRAVYLNSRIPFLLYLGLHQMSFFKIPNWESAKSFPTVQVWFRSVTNYSLLNSDPTLLYLGFH